MMASSGKQKERTASTPATPAARSPVIGVLWAVVVAAAVLGPLYQASQLLGLSLPLSLLSRPAAIPSQAQLIDQRTFNVLPHVPPPSQFNGSSKVPISPPPRVILWLT